jgi:Helix-turn-helix.
MLTNWMGYDILKEVSISDILEAKMKRTIGERLKKARKDAKIRQGAAAEKMEMSRTTLSAIESDKRLVWAEEITKFAEMYKV